MSQVNSAIEGNYADAGGGTSLTSGAGNDELDKDAFLKLLITQFQHQDPLNPMEDKEFIAQLAQFSALEQSMALNDSMGKLIVSTDYQTTISITSYIGKEVTGRGLGVSKKEGDISLIKYGAGEAVSDCYVNIVDAAGQVVSTVQLGARAAGIHEFNWDGKSSNGSDAADGVYTAAFSGKNEAGEPVFIDTSVSGRVTGTSFYNGEYFLRMSDGRSMSLGNVVEVVEPTEKVVVPGKVVTGTDEDNYLVGGKGADEISALGGNDIIVYDPIDEIVDAGEGCDFLIATGDVGENATGHEAILRGATADKIKSLKDLADMGLVFTADGKEIDVTHADWTANWKDVGKGQWTYTSREPSTDKKVTIEILSKINDPAPDPAPEATRSSSPAAPRTASARAAEAVNQIENGISNSTGSNKVNFSEALRKGMSGVVNDTADSLSNNVSSKINRMMKAMNGQELNLYSLSEGMGLT